MRLKGWVRVCVVVLMGALGLPGGEGVAAGAAVSGALGPRVHKYEAGMWARDLAKRPATDVVELKNGKRVSVGKVRELKSALQNMRRQPGSRFSMTRYRPGASVATIRDSSDLKKALGERKDSDTVTLPSGRKAPVAWIKVLQPAAERRAGRSIASAAVRPKLDGPAKTVSSQAELKNFMNLPPDTILESKKSKKRITVGMLQQAVAAGKIKIPKESMSPARGTTVPRTPATAPIKAPGKK